MLIRAAIACVVVFLGSCLIARQIALSKNHRPDVIIIAGIVVGAICFGLLWTLSLAYGGGYTKLAGAALLSVMPAVAAWIVPPREQK
jgi:uncharacterized membrane protein YedE/YeeE